MSPEPSMQQPPGSGARAVAEGGAAGRNLPASRRKREAIAQAAVRLFQLDGYERTSVDAIAATAGVSKRTVYNHYGDKQNLFLSVVRDTYASLRTRFAEVSARVLASPDDLAHGLLTFAREATSLVTRSPGDGSPDGGTLVRLVITEAPHFPALRDAWMQAEPLSLGLAEPLARLSAAGHLEVADPAEAARHLFALTVDHINARTLFGAIPLSEHDIDRILTRGVDAFLRAYRAAGPGSGPDGRAWETPQ